MSDLIDRQAAIDASEKFIKDCNPEHFVGHQKFIEYMDNAEIGSFGKWQFANGFNMGLTATEVAIKKLPSAQPTAEPVRHGKNIATDYDEVDQFVCSECGIELQDWHRVERDDYDGEETYHEYRLRYCPNCGCRMDKE